METLHTKNKLFSCFSHSGSILIYNEIKRNLIPFLLPLPIYLILLILNLMSDVPEIVVNTNGTWAYIAIGILFAMIYGLQCFSQDADKKTLDFILTRPISLYLIIIIKYLTSISIFLLWSFLIRTQIQLDLSQLPLPKGIGEEWVFLIFLTIHSISLFSGLLVKGLERFVAVIALTGAMTFLCYQYWKQLFDLLMANYFWFDIPPYQMNFVIKIFPVFLAVLSLITPLVATLWQLKNRIPLQHFNAGKTIIGIWLSTYLLTLLVQYLFAPPLWSNRTFKYGDWHEKAGIITVSTIDSSYEDKLIFNSDQVKFNLSLAHLGQKSKILYQGYDLNRPSISPDGKRVAFIEGKALKLLDIKTRKIIEVFNPKPYNNSLNVLTNKQQKPSISLRVNFAVWGEDNEHLIYVNFLNNLGLSDIYLLHHQNGFVKKINREPITVADLVWDSFENALYIIGNDLDNAITHLNTESLIMKTFSMPDKFRPTLKYAINGPCMIDHKTGKMILVMKFIETIRIYTFDTKKATFDLVEQYSDERIKPNAPILINNNLTAFIFSRLDGTFQYKATKIYIDHNHVHGPECDHDHDHVHGPECDHDH